jgi:hypothetical protein
LLNVISFNSSRTDGEELVAIALNVAGIRQTRPYNIVFPDVSCP